MDRHWYYCRTHTIKANTFSYGSSSFSMWRRKLVALRFSGMDGTTLRYSLGGIWVVAECCLGIFMWADKNGSATRRPWQCLDFIFCASCFATEGYLKWEFRIEDNRWNIGIICRMGRKYAHGSHRRISTSFSHFTCNIRLCLWTGRPIDLITIPKKKTTTEPNYIRRMYISKENEIHSCNQNAESEEFSHSANLILNYYALWEYTSFGIYSIILFV